MIVNFFNSETGDKCFVEIFNGGTCLELNETIVKELCNEYKTEMRYSFSTEGLIQYIKNYGYKIHKINIHNIEFSI